MFSQFKDSTNFLSKLTRAKVKNYLAVKSSYRESVKGGEARHRGLPVSLSIEPTTSCNLRCPECPSGLRSFSRATGMLDVSLYEKIIHQVKDHLLYLTLYFQGEPYLHQQFDELVKIANGAGIYTSTSTNGHYLDSKRAEQTVKSGIDRLIISIDGTTQETYEQYRVGGQLSKVLEGTRNVVEWKRKLRSKTPFIIFQYLVVGPNEHQIQEVKELAKDIGVDHVAFKTAQIYNYEKGSPLIPENPKYSRYRKNQDGDYELNFSIENECWRMWQGAVVTWDGDVVPCCFDKDADHKMGSLQEKPLSEIWSGKDYQSFRNQLLEDRSKIEMCKNCTEGAQVWA